MSSEARQFDPLFKIISINLNDWEFTLLQKSILPVDIFLTLNP